MQKNHQIIWYRPGKVTPKEFRLKPWLFSVLMLLPVLFTAVFVVGVFFFVSFNLRMDELQNLRAENDTLRAQIGRVYEIDRQLKEMERFQAQVRRGLTEGADLQRIMEAGEAVEWERPAQLPESDWLPVSESRPASREGSLDLLAASEVTSSLGLPQLWPLEGFVTRGFEFSQIDPGSSHSGIDLAAPRGTPVRVVATGTVISADWSPRYGNRVMVDHGGSLISAYGHNELLLVETGDRVEAGDPIALSGNSGISTAPHLHFEIWLNGRAVDPRALLPQRGEHDEEG